jgi:hypothetical protein
MNKFLLAATSVISLAAIALYFATRSESIVPSRASKPDTSNPTDNAASKPTANPSQKFSARTVLQIDPSIGSGATSSTSAAQLQRPLTLAQELLVSRNYAAIYAKLNTLPQSAETLGVRAAILDRCGRRTDRNPHKPFDKDEARAKFIANLPVNHPNNELRIRAHDFSATSVCAGFPDTPVTKIEIDAAYQAAIAAGDSVAKAREIECALYEPEPGKGRNSNQSPTLTDERFNTFKSILASKDPRAIQLMGGLLANSYANGAIQFDPSSEPADPQSVFHAMELIACEYGRSCDNVLALRGYECADFGRCNAASLAEHISFYNAAPAASQEIERIRSAVHTMIERGNFSELKFVKGAANTNIRGSFHLASCN